MTSQNLYAQSKLSKTILRSLSEIIAFESKNDQGSLTTLSKQVLGDSRLLPAAMEWLNEHAPSPHDRYLFIDMNPINHIDSRCRVRTGILNPLRQICFASSRALATGRGKGKSAAP